MTHGSLFSGIGGFDLAAEWMGWENKFHCEWNEFGQKVLHYYWPKAELFTDITKSDFTKYANKIDIISGGFPCQPYSNAGKRLGKADDRHLWPEMHRAIREISPSWVVGENVRGLTNWNGGLVFDEVQADLEAEGYEVTPFLLPACAVNAPHRRDRIWFVAYSNNTRTDIGLRGKSEWSKDNGKRGFTQFESWKNDGNEYATNTNDNDRGCSRSNINEKKEHIFSKFTRFSKEQNATDTTILGLRNCTNTRQISREKRNATKERSEPTLFIKTNDNGHKSNWENFPTVSPICNGDDGLSNRLDNITFPKWRNESIKAGGNAIVPQVVYQIFKAIQEYERINNSK